MGVDCLGDPPPTLAAPHHRDRQRRQGEFGITGVSVVSVSESIFSLRVAPDGQIDNER